MGEDVSDSLVEWNHDLKHNSIPVVVIVLLYMFVGCTGNALVIYIYTRAMKAKVNRFFIPYLAVVDILSLTFNGILEIVFDFYPVTFDSDAGCRFIRFFGNVLVILSGILLVMIALQRYFLVCRPLSNSLTLTKKKILLAAVTVFTIAISAPKFVFTGSMEIDTIYPNVTGTVCGIPEKFAGTTYLLVYNYILALTALICTLVLSGLYILLVRAIRSRNVKLKQLKESKPKLSLTEISTDDISGTGNETDEVSMAAGTAAVGGNQNGMKSVSNVNIGSHAAKLKRLMVNTRFSWMFFTITVLCVITYVPRMALENMEALDKNFQRNYSFSTRAFIGFLESFYLFNSVANPFIYGMFDQEFRNHVRNIFVQS